MSQLYGQLKNSDGTTRWKPIEAILQSDGGYAIRVDTELVLDSGNISIGNIKVGSTNQTSNSLRYLRVESDGTLVVISTPLDLYEVADIDDENEPSPNYFGYVDMDGNWYIMEEDQSAGTYRYFKGTSDYPTNWATRSGLAYDYYYNIF